MKTFKLCLLLLVPFVFLKAQTLDDKEIASLSQQAHHLAEAHAYTQAGALYEQLLKLSLPPWQHARLLYNLGTVRLSQHQTTEALALFQSIQPTTLSLPRFGRDLLLNEGIAHLQQAQLLTAKEAPLLLDQQAFFIRQGLEALAEAQTLSCQEQQTDQLEASACEPDLLVSQWSAHAHVELQKIQQQKRDNWLKNASIQSVAAFLQDSLQQLKQVMNVDKEASYASYFQHQAESFFPIWNALQEKKLSAAQQESFHQAASFYLNMLALEAKKNEPAALQGLQDSIDALAPLAFKPEEKISHIRLKIELLLLQERFSVANLLALQTELEALKETKNQKEALEKVKTSLQMSLKQLKANQMTASRFFLLTSLSQINVLFEKQATTSKAILKQAVAQADRTLQLFFLWELMPGKTQGQPMIQEIVKDAQQQTLAWGPRFIQTVLTEQKVSFQQANCQQFPWDQVIPLFEKGYHKAQQVNQQLALAPVDHLQLLVNQGQAIQEWQQALHLLLQPPQPQQINSSSTTPQASENLNETFRLIQEMYLEDQSDPQPAAQELHSW
jgi:hypothetical protein